ncbi:hypothetical protein KKH56_05505 [bacterium]|nr:hypothetical protein [bacterium]
MNQRVYIETSIPSFYHEIRTEPEMVARRNWTRQWWDQQSYHYELVTSLGVIEELGKGDYPTKSDTLALIKSLPVLPVEDPIPEIIKHMLLENLCLLMLLVMPSIWRWHPIISVISCSHGIAKTWLMRISLIIST